VRAVQVWPFAALAFGLLLVEGLPRPTRSARRPGLGRPARIAAATGLGVAGLLLAAPSPAGDDVLQPLDELETAVREHPEDPAGLVALGAARLERGRRDAAARAFLAAALKARDPGAAAAAYFDLGVAELEREDLPAARRAFLDALAMDPGDERARFNLEWTLLALAQRAPEESAGADEPGEDPESGPDDEPPPLPLPAPESLPEPSARPPPEMPPLSEPQQERLLERIEDDPGRALRSAAREAEVRGRRGGVVW
jgi:tetratricopeptide (TPR) repeat protein